MQEQLPALTEAGVSVVALSTDGPGHAREMIDKCQLTFPVGYGLPLTQTAATLGAYYEERRGILHATGFVLRRDGSVGVACYSSGAIGRLVSEDVVRIVRFWDR